MRNQGPARVSAQREGHRCRRRQALRYLIMLAAPPTQALRTAPGGLEYDFSCSYNGTATSSAEPLLCCSSPPPPVGGGGGGGARTLTLTIADGGAPTNASLLASLARLLTQVRAAGVVAGVGHFQGCLLSWGRCDWTPMHPGWATGVGPQQ